VVVADADAGLGLDLSLLPLLAGQGQVHVQISSVGSLHVSRRSDPAVAIWKYFNEELIFMIKIDFT